ncbi:hypothetical protein D3C73_331960 [compost metagenome]
MDKPSELSKPVAYKFDHGVMGPGDFKYGTPQMHSAAKDENSSPLYSQEYVSALLAELEAKDKRIAELESMATDYAGKFQKAQDAAKHLIIMNDRAQAEIAHLKASLATPVRLPGKTSDLDSWDGGWDACLEECATAIRAAGFTVSEE